MFIANLEEPLVFTEKGLDETAQMRHVCTAQWREATAVLASA